MENRITRIIIIGIRFFESTSRLKVDTAVSLLLTLLPLSSSPSVFNFYLKNILAETFLNSHKLKKNICILMLTCCCNYFERGSTGWITAAQIITGQNIFSKYVWSNVIGPVITSINLNEWLPKSRLARTKTLHYRYYKTIGVILMISISDFLPKEMVNNFICHTCSWPNLT